MIPKPSLRPLAAPAFFILLSLTSRLPAAPADYYRITVVDSDTGRGVPLVELRTVSAERFYTDSNGIVAVGEPDLMGRNVWFSVKSHGYEYPADGFGSRGVALPVVAGGRAQIKLRRINVAERLYRITGSGIYRDSVLVGQPAPIAHPLMDGLVVGQDTVMATPYKGKLYWFYGDTNRPGYPLGQFATSGATSLPPGAGGLDPDRGIDLTYWVDGDGFSKKMLPLPGGGGPVWVGGVFTLREAGGVESLYTHYSHLDGAGKLAAQGLALFSDSKALFELICKFANDAPLYPDGQPFHVTVAGRPYLYCQSKSLQACRSSEYPPTGRTSPTRAPMRPSPAWRPARARRARTRGWTAPPMAACGTAGRRTRPPWATTPRKRSSKPGR